MLLNAYGRVEAREKRPGDLVTDADTGSQRLIAGRILDAFPDHTILAEEDGLVADPSRSWRWVVDPLDGTINFAHGFPFWAVSIALEHEGRLVVGVVHDPLAGATYSASLGRGASAQRQGGERQCRGPAARQPDRHGDCPSTSRTDVDRQMSLFRRFSTGTHSVRRTGSSALNLALVAAGGFDVCYATFMNPWDAAAGVVLVREAGGMVTDLRGATYDVYGEEILATNGRVHAESLRWIDECHPGRATATPPARE